MYPCYISSGLMIAGTIATAYPRTTTENESARLDCVPKMAGFLKANNLRQDIRFNHKIIKGFNAVGCNWNIGNNPPYIEFNKFLLNVEPDGTRFFLKRACYQIKGNHTLFIRIVLTTTLVYATTIFTSETTSRSYKAILMIAPFLAAILLLTNSLLHDISDYGADKFAIKNSTVEELQGALKILAGLGKLNSAVGDKIRDELKQRKVDIPVISEETLEMHSQIYK